MDNQQLIDQEVQRRVARQQVAHQQEMNELKVVVTDLKDQLSEQNEFIKRMTAEPLYFGRILRASRYPDSNIFNYGDEVFVLDRASVHAGKLGKIISKSPCIDDNGCVQVQFNDDTTETLRVGLESKGVPQVRLTQKPDGTSTIVSVDGKPWEVLGVPDLTLEEGEWVKIRAATKQIVGRGTDLEAGPICRVIATTPDWIEVMDKGENKMILNPKNLPVKEGDRVIADSSHTTLIRVLPKDNRQRFKISETKVTWDDVGGLEAAKKQLREAIELPYQQPELFAHYGIKREQGILLYGPPGTGKTLLVRVLANVLASIHGKEAMETGYLYVTSPSILDKWVGNTEAEIRELFQRCREHFWEHGYPAILAFDEADAILPQRGTRISSSISDTIVPMFLGEMQGVDEKQTEANPIVVLMTNRAELLDPAVVRPGRISRHIKIDRPDHSSSLQILQIHAARCPFANEGRRLPTLAVTVQDLFSKSRILYRLNNEHDFTLGDAVNGAMLEAIIEQAKMLALTRDLGNRTQTGILDADLRQAVQELFDKQRGLSHAFDLEDFSMKLGLDPKAVNYQRCFGAA